MPLKLNVSTKFLASLAIVQSVLVVVLILETRTLRGDQVARAEVSVGLGLGEATILLESGARLALREVVRHSDYTALLAVHSGCAWCDSVAPEWAKLLREERSYRVLLLGREAIDSLRAYAERKPLSASVISVHGAPDGSLERAIAGRTPWIYLVDSVGTLHYSDNGRTLGSLDSVVRALRLGK